MLMLATNKGLDFFTLAKHLTSQIHAGKLPTNWISLTDAKGRTMLHYASQKGDMNVV